MSLVQTLDVFQNLPDTLIALGTLIGAVGAVILTLRNGRTQSKAKEAAELAAKAVEDAKAQLALIDGKIVELGAAVDGRLSKLLEEVQRRSHAEGKAEGKTEEKDEERDRKNGTRAVEAASEVIDVKIVGTKGTVPVTVKNQKKVEEESDSGFKK